MILLLRITASISILMLAAVVLSSLFDLSTKNGQPLTLLEVIGDTIASVIASAWIVFLLYVLERMQ